ncbi:hypothetical protein C8039_20100 [Halogeometricum sp. wsp3]|nr:hypothetical protein C8039_20100 [Halogeometricum sp. wsp3]
MVCEDIEPLRHRFVKLAVVNLSKGFVLTLIVTLLVLSAMRYGRFSDILGAVLLAYVLYPLQIRLETYVSPMLAALSLVTLAVTGFVAPVVVVLASIMESADRILREFGTDPVNSTYSNHGSRAHRS